MSANPNDPSLNWQRLGPLIPNPGRYPILPALTPQQEVALLCRVLFAEGYNDHIAGHITYRMDDGTMLVNPWELAWDEVTASDILRIDTDGRILEGQWNVTPAINVHRDMHALRHDVEGFVQEELAARRQPAYPPFVALANVVVSGPDETATMTAALAAVDWVRALLERRGMRDVQVVGPAPCPIERIKERWRWHFLLKTPRAALMTRVAGYIAAHGPLPPGRDLRLVVDRDPVSLL